MVVDFEAKIKTLTAVFPKTEKSSTHPSGSKERIGVYNAQSSRSMQHV
jgi:hypothetical protein